MDDDKTPGPSLFTFADPSDAQRFEAGDVVMFHSEMPRWWMRLWRWMLRGFRRAPEPPRMTVIAVDHAEGVMTIEHERVN